MRSRRTAEGWAVLLYCVLSPAAWLVLLPLVEDNNAAVRVGAIFALFGVVCLFVAILSRGSVASALVTSMIPASFPIGILVQCNDNSTSGSVWFWWTLWITVAALVIIGVHAAGSWFNKKYGTT
jgi:hypothetical protein